MFSDWLGVFVDVGEVPDWDEIAAIIVRAYRMTAPCRLIAELDER